MRLETIRRSLLGSIFVVLTSVLLGSCGGGGASNEGIVGGPPVLQPATGTFYAGVEYTFTATGGRTPYVLSSSEPSLMAVPSMISGHTFSVVPANTAVIDSDLEEDELPVRSVTITMRDSLGNVALSTIQVAQNFFTGYGVFFASNCPGTGTAAGPAFCANGETAVQVTAAINGNRFGNREYRFEIVRGPMFFVNIPGNGTVGPGASTWTTRTDHEGDAHAIIRTNANIATQVGVIRVVDTATGVSTQYVVTLNGVPITGGTLTAIPEEFTLTGRDSATCGTGTGDFQVFGGLPPYTATSSFPSALLVDPEVSNENPGRFRFSASNPFFCMNPGTITITDRNGARATVEVTTELGSADPPPPPMALTPASLTLVCGSSGTAIISGGSGTFTAASPDGRLSIALSDRALTVTRLAVDPAGTPASPTPGVANPVQFAINVTDGTNVTTLSVTAPSNCPP